MMNRLKVFSKKKKRVWSITKLNATRWMKIKRNGRPTRKWMYSLTKSGSGSTPREASGSWNLGGDGTLPVQVTSPLAQAGLRRLPRRLLRRRLLLLLPVVSPPLLGRLLLSAAVSQDCSRRPPRRPRRPARRGAGAGPGGLAPALLPPIPLPGQPRLRV